MISKDIVLLLGIILFVIITVLFVTLKIEWAGYVLMIGIPAIMLTYFKFYTKKEDPDEDIDWEHVDDWDKKRN